MAESTQAEPSPVQASFATHVQAFHGSLPPEEQTMLEQVFALAQSASQEQQMCRGLGVVWLPGYIQARPGEDGQLGA